MKIMYDLSALEEWCDLIGYPCSRETGDCLLVHLTGEVSLEFRNFSDETDALVGFRCSGWHVHGTLNFLTGGGSSIDLDETEVLLALKVGTLIIEETYVEGALSHRCLTHCEELQPLKYLRANQELRFYRVPDPAA